MIGHVDGLNIVPLHNSISSSAWILLSLDSLVIDRSGSVLLLILLTFETLNDVFLRDGQL